MIHSFSLSNRFVLGTVAVDMWNGPKFCTESNQSSILNLAAVSHQHDLK